MSTSDLARDTGRYRDTFTLLQKESATPLSYTDFNCLYEGYSGEVGVLSSYACEANPKS